MKTRKGSLKSLLDNYQKLKSSEENPKQKEKLLKMKQKINEIFNFIDERLQKIEPRKETNINMQLRKKRERAIIVI